MTKNEPWRLVLSPKCYSIKDNQVAGPQGEKLATKGVHADDLLEHQNFYDSLYSNKLLQVKQSNLRMLQKQKRMALIETSKNALNNVFTKLRVSENNVTVSPLTQNNMFV